MADDDPAAIDREFPGWHAFRSRPERGRLARYWASWTGAGRPLTVDGDSLPELRMAIRGADAGGPDG